MNKLWNIPEVGETNEDLNIVKRILKMRNIKEQDAIHEFISDKPKLTYDPFLLKNMTMIVSRIIYHLTKKNKIVIVGDYDVDGVTSTALLMEFLGGISSNVDYYIPNRFTEGYGLNIDAINHIKDVMGAELVITVDNGISAINEVAHAKDIGLEIIITDHHNPPSKLPDCLILNPKQLDDEYPCDQLCGCGVAFKLMQGLQKTLGLEKARLSKSLDLVALATICDMVPLLDENRTLVKYGLKRINNNGRLGIAALRHVVGLYNKDVTAGRIGYIIGPCFNAAGRINDAKLGVKLLLCDNKKDALNYATQLFELNKERRETQEDGEIICDNIVKRQHLEDDFLVVNGGHISEGVIGIVAGRIKDKYYRPTLVVTESDEEGVLKGSGRSISGINIYDELSACSDLFVGFGGHAMACGFSIREENLKELRSRLNFRATRLKAKSPTLFVPKINITATLMAEEFTVDTINEIAKLEPYGMGNPRPIFYMDNLVVDKANTRGCGKTKKHLKLVGNLDGTKIDGIGFSLVEKYFDLGTPNQIKIAFTLDINEYMGRVSPQIVLEDFDII